MLPVPLELLLETAAVDEVTLVERMGEETGAEVETETEMETGTETDDGKPDELDETGEADERDEPDEIALL